MVYCPRCRTEYPGGARECFDCKLALVPGEAPRRRLPDVEDLVVPGIMLVLFLVAAGLLALRLLVEAGEISSPILTLFVRSQLPCMTVFLVIAVLVSGVFLLTWFLRTVLRM